MISEHPELIENETLSTVHRNPSASDPAFDPSALVPSSAPPTPKKTAQDIIEKKIASLSIHLVILAKVILQWILPRHFRLELGNPESIILKAKRCDPSVITLRLDHKGGNPAHILPQNPTRSFRIDDTVRLLSVDLAREVEGSARTNK